MQKTCQTVVENLIRCRENLDTVLNFLRRWAVLVTPIRFCTKDQDTLIWPYLDYDYKSLFVRIYNTDTYLRRPWFLFVFLLI